MHRCADAMELSDAAFASAHAASVAAASPADREEPASHDGAVQDLRVSQPRAEHEEEAGEAVDMLKSRCVSEPLSWYIRVRRVRGLSKSSGIFGVGGV